MKRILLLFLLLGLALSGCAAYFKGASTAAPTAVVASLAPQASPPPKYGQEVARPLIRDLTNIGARVAGTDGEAKAAAYISQVFSVMGYKPETQPFSATSGDKTIKSANVMASKQGQSAQEIIVGAHYDSADIGLGADDNASGVAVMLELAKLLQNASTPYTIRFIAFGAGESGLLGSYAYLNQMTQEEFENIVGMIDLDSLAAGDIAYVYSDEGQQSILRDWALDWALGNGYDLQTVKNADLSSQNGGKGASDYAPFRDAGIPYAFFQATNWNLGDKKGTTQVDVRYGENGVIQNTQDDTLAYLDSTFPGRVNQHLNLFISVLYAMLTQFQAPIQ